MCEGSRTISPSNSTAASIVRTEFNSSSLNPTADMLSMTIVYISLREGGPMTHTHSHTHSNTYIPASFGGAVGLEVRVRIEVAMMRRLLRKQCKCYSNTYTDQGALVLNAYNSSFICPISIIL